MATSKEQRLKEGDKLVAEAEKWSVMNIQVHRIVCQSVMECFLYAPLIGSELRNYVCVVIGCLLQPED